MRYKDKHEIEQIIRVANSHARTHLVAGPVRNVRLAVNAQIRAVRVKHHHRVEVRVAGLLKERDRKHHLWGGKRKESGDKEREK